MNSTIVGVKVITFCREHRKHTKTSDFLIREGKDTHTHTLHTVCVCVFSRSLLGIKSDQADCGKAKHPCTRLSTVRRSLSLSLWLALSPNLPPPSSGLSLSLSLALSLSLPTIPPSIGVSLSLSVECSLSEPGQCGRQYAWWQDGRGPAAGVLSSPLPCH